MQVSQEILWCRRAFDQFSVRKFCSAADFFKTCQRLGLDVQTVAVPAREVLIFQVEDSDIELAVVLKLAINTSPEI